MKTDEIKLKRFKCTTCGGICFLYSEMSSIETNTEYGVCTVCRQKEGENETPTR